PLRLDLAALALTGRARQVFAAPGDDAGAVPRTAATLLRHAQRTLEEIGNALEVTVRGRAEEPHHQEKGHHRGDEVRVGDLPRATVMGRVPLVDAADDDGL